MRLYRVSVEMTQTTFGWLEVEADDPGLAIETAMAMDPWDIEDGAEWGSCVDETSIRVDLQYGAEDITPMSASDELWS